jgi:TPR repeat protein
MRRATLAALRMSLVLALGLGWSPAMLGQEQSKDTGQQKAKPKAKKEPLKPEVREQRYQQAAALERKGDHRGALNAYLEAGDSGHGLAQKRLAEIYDKGSPATKRDYGAALRWYEKARAQGVEVPKPHAYTKGR